MYCGYGNAVSEKSIEKVKTKNLMSKWALIGSEVNTWVEMKNSPRTSAKRLKLMYSGGEKSTSYLGD